MITKNNVFPVVFFSLLVNAAAKTSQFSKATLCDLQARQSYQCMKQVSSRDSVLRCSVRCTLANSCIGFSVDKSRHVCYLHTACPNVTGCKIPDQTLQSYLITPLSQPPCYNGTWNETSQVCVCSKQWSGLACDRRAVNCIDFYTYHKRLTGYHEILVHPPTYSYEFTMTCLITVKDVRSVFFANSGGMTFNRSWTDYVQGFHKDTSNTWLGLEAMYFFLNASSKRDLAFKLTFKTHTIELRYSLAQIRSSATNYTLYMPYGSSSNNITEEDCLPQSHMAAFSTWQERHDPDLNESCVQEAGSGWWFQNCNFTCNPLGAFFTWSPAPATDRGYVTIPGSDQQYIKDNLVILEMTMNEKFTS